MGERLGDAAVLRAKKLADALKHEAKLLRRDGHRLESVSAIRVYYWELQQLAVGLREEARAVRSTLSQTELSVENLRVQKELLEEEIQVEEKEVAGVIADVCRRAGLPLPSEEGEDTQMAEADGDTKCEQHDVIRDMFHKEEADRTALVAEVGEKTMERESLEQQLNDMRRAYQALPDDLEKLTQVGRVVQSTCRALTLRLDDSAPDYNLLRHMPLPLYVIAQDLLGFKTTHQGIRVDINQPSTSLPVPVPRTSADYHRCNDSSVVLRFSVGESSTSVTFAYMPHLEIVGVSVRTQLRAGSSTYNDTVSFATLFPGDDGLSSPNPANAHLLDGSFIYTPGSTSPTNGLRAFVWANLLGGLEYPPVVGGGRGALPAELSAWYARAQGTSRHTRIGAVVEALRRRVEELAGFESQVGQLFKHKIPGGASVFHDKGLRIARFSEKAGHAQNDDREFIFDFRNSQQPVVALVGTVLIPAAHPLVPLRWRLSPSAGAESVGEQDAQAIEDAVNGMTAGSTGAGSLLQDQVITLLSAIALLDVQSTNATRDGSHSLHYNAVTRRFE